MAEYEQLSFRGGVLSPFAGGTANEEAYKLTGKKCENFIPLPHGALLKRAGVDIVNRRVDSPQHSFIWETTDHTYIVYISTLNSLDFINVNSGLSVQSGTLAGYRDHAVFGDSILILHATGIDVYKRSQGAITLQQPVFTPPTDYDFDKRGLSMELFKVDPQPPTGGVAYAAHFFDSAGAVETLKAFPDGVFYLEDNETPYLQWVASTAFVLYDRIEYGDNIYLVTTAGSTGVTPPTFVADGEVVDPAGIGLMFLTKRTLTITQVPTPAGHAIVNKMVLDSYDGIALEFTHNGNTFIRAPEVFTQKTHGSINYERQGTLEGFDTITFHQTRLVLTKDNTIYGSRVDNFYDFKRGTDEDDPYELSVGIAGSKFYWSISSHTLLFGCEEGVYSLYSGTDARGAITPRSFNIELSLEMKLSSFFKPIMHDGVLFLLDISGHRLYAATYVDKLTRIAAKEISLNVDGLAQRIYSVAVSYTPVKHFVVRNLYAGEHWNFTLDNDLNPSWFKYSFDPFKNRVIRAIHTYDIHTLYLAEDYNPSYTLIARAVVHYANLTSEYNLDLSESVTNVNGELFIDNTKSLCNKVTANVHLVATNASGLGNIYLGEFPYSKTTGKISNTDLINTSLYRDVVAGSGVEATFETNTLFDADRYSTGVSSTTRINDVKLQVHKTDEGLYINGTPVTLNPSFNNVMRTHEEAFTGVARLNTQDSGYQDMTTVEVKHSSPLDCCILNLVAILTKGNT